MAIRENEFGEGIAVVGEPEIDDGIALVVNEPNHSVLLDGSDTFCKHPGPAVLCRHGNLSRVHIVVTAFLLGTEYRKRIHGRFLSPIKFDVLNGDLAGSCVFDGDFSIGSLNGNQVVIAKKSLVNHPVFDFVFVGRTASHDGGNCDETDGAPGCCCDADFVDCFHFERGLVDVF